MAAKKSAAKKTAKKATAKKAAVKRIGRPPKKASERKDIKIMVRVTRAQKAALVKLAHDAGQDVSTFMLDAALSSYPKTV